MTHNEAPHIHRFVMTSCNGPCEESLVKTSGVGHFCYICDCGERYKEQTAPTEPLSAEQFAELLTWNCVNTARTRQACGGLNEAQAAYATLLARNTALDTRCWSISEQDRRGEDFGHRCSLVLGHSDRHQHDHCCHWQEDEAEQQLREARAEVERLKLAIGNIPDGAAALLDGIRAAREVARHNPLHNQPFCPDCEALVEGGQP